MRPDFLVRIVLAAALAALLGAARPPLAFIPAEPRFASAAGEYAAIWARDGARIVAALERVSGLAFPDLPIDAIVSGGSPMASYDGRTIRLRARYAPDFKQATLVHELGHRLAFTLPRPTGLDDHRLLYLFLYDVWTDLYGQDFADRIVRIERRIPGPFDYDDAWSWALRHTREQRQARLRLIRAAAEAEPPRRIVDPF